MSLLARDGRFTSDLRNANEVLHHVVPAAAVLRLNGEDLVTRRYGDHTLRDAVATHARAVQAIGATPITTAGDPTDPARSIFRAQGQGTHLAWIPVYLALDPTSEASDEVRRLDRQLRQGDRTPYFSGQMSMHAGCLFGRAV